MNDEQIKKILIKNEFSPSHSSEEWKNISNKIQKKRDFSFSLKVTIPAMIACMLVLTFGIFQYQSYQHEQDQLAEFLSESADYFDVEESDQFYL